MSGFPDDPEPEPKDSPDCGICAKLLPYLTDRRTMSKMSDAQLLHAILALYDHNRSETARQILVRRETIHRWLNEGRNLALLPRQRRYLLQHLALNKRD